MKIHIKAGKGKFFTEKELIEAAKEKPVENLDDKIKEDKSFKLQGKMEFQGMKIAIENKKGSVRRGVDDDGEEWKTKMFYPYGFIVGTEGVDHDEVDCFVGPNNESSTVFIIHQQNPETKKYDEDKCMLGFDTLEQARDAYLAHYDDQAFLGTITQMDIQEFKNKLKTRKGKIIKAFDKVLAFIKGKQFNPGQFSMFGSSNDAPVIEGQTVSKDGKIYEYRVSKKNPFVKRLFRKEDEPGMFDAPKEEPEHGAEPGTNSEIKPETKKPEEKPESKKKPKIKLGNQEFDLFAQDKTEDKKEPISPEIKPDDSKKEPENKPDNKPSESENKPKPNKDPKPKEETQEEIETAAEVVKGKKTREKLNEQVRQILESKTDEELTAEDLQVIAKYSGRGGLGGDNLDDISLNEFYTREVEIGFIWDIIRKFGYNGGRALEPSAGTGNFIRLAPGDTIVTGVEIDPISSRVGKILYGDKHDMLEAQSFEEFNRNSDGGEFDAVIGNCPFGQRGGSLVHDPEKKDIMKHEQYFIDRGIDALKNGGVLGMIVPTGVMDNQWNDWRLEINKKAEFLGAIRLPDGAFKHANAAVTTDIVFFRKRPQEVIDYLQNVKKSDLPALYDNMILDAEFIAGKYYENNPQYAIGEKTRGQFESQTVWKGNVRREDLDQVGEILKDNQDDYSSLGIDIAPVPETQLNVGDIKQVNGRTYRLNENHRWERVSEEEQKEIEVSDEVKTMLGIKNYAEFEALRQDTARVIELTRDQIKLLENPLWNKELELHEVQGDYKNEMLKRAVIIGLEIKQFRQDLFDGKLSTSEAQMKAEKLSGLLENFKNEYGHPIHNARLDKYFKKSNEKPLVYISGAFDDKGNLAQIFSDPAAYYKVYNTSFEVGALDDKDILNIVNYFFENHIPADLESIKNSYTGEENVERALLNSEDIFLDEDGNYQPINEVCMGEVYSKIDKWDQMKSDIEKKLSAEDITDEERELLVLKSRKIESQIYELKRRAGSKELQYMPVMMNDANKLFPIEHLNQFLQAQLGADFADQIIYDPRTNLFTLQDESLRELYTLYIDKGSNDKEDKKRMQELLKAYFNKDDNPVMLIALNKVNGVALPALRSEKGERLLEKVNGLDAAFKEYLVNVEDADKITDNYNRAYNNYIQKKFDDRPIEGLSKFAYDREIKKDAEGNPIVARDKAGAHSWATVRRMYEQGKGLIAHGVGLGKTLEGIILCLLSKETGRAKKPLIVTPKSVLINWAEEIRKWTNEVNFLVVGYTEKMVDGKMKWVEDNKEEKQLKLQRIATEDFDMVLISRDTYRNIDFSPETKNNMLKELANKYFELPEKPSKKVKAKYDKLMASLAKVMTNKDAIEGVYLDNLGIDMVIRDEGHDTKNLLVPMEEEIAGINSTMSQRALHNFFSSKIIRGQNGEKGVFTLTATPISNSPLEVFNMMLPFAEKELQDLGVKNMDEFIQKFAYTEVVPTADPDGRIVEKSKFAGWKSPDILRKIFFRFTDYMTKDDLTPEESKSAGIKFPKETPHKVISHLNDGQRALMEHCRLRLYAVRYKKKIYNDQGELTGIEFDEKKMQDDIQAGLVTEKYLKLTEQYFNGEYLPRFNELNSKRNPEDNPIDDTYFAIQSDMIKIASDLDWYKEAQEPKKDKNGNLIPDIRFGKKIDENYVNQYNDVHKMNQLTEGVAGMYKSGGKQIIFAINTSLHEKLRRDFIAAGVKPEEIAIVNGATMKTGEDRVRVSREFNAGKYKVIIGNYATMGEGLNFNKMTSDIHHLQPAWNYLMIEQGNGRGIRQGNDLDFVNTHYYLTRGSVDTFMHDKIMTKGRMVDDFMRGLNNKWDDEVKMDEDELMIALADNPEEAERIYKSRENKLQKVLEEKEKNKNYSQFDQIFTIKNQMNRIEDKESKRYKSLAQELENLKNRLNNSNFSHKQHLDLDEKPIIIPTKNEVIPVGSVLKFGNNEDDAKYMVIDDYSPSTGKIRCTIPEGYEPQYKSMHIKDFTKNFGVTITKADIDKPGMYKDLLSRNKIGARVFYSIPKDILEMHRDEVLKSMSSINPYVLYKNMDGQYKASSYNQAINAITKDGGKIIFPQEDEQFPKYLQNIIENEGRSGYSYGEYLARAVYGYETWQKEIKKAIRRLKGEATEINFHIPKSGASFLKKLNELQEKGHLTEYRKKDIIKDFNSSKYWSNRTALLNYQEALKKEFYVDYGINTNEDDDILKVPEGITPEMLDRARAIDDIYDSRSGKSLEEILNNHKAA